MTTTERIESLESAYLRLLEQLGNNSDSWDCRSDADIRSEMNSIRIEISNLRQESE